MRYGRSAVLDIYRRLYAHYGPQGWWPAKTLFEMMAGAVLTQSTAWANVERALDRLGRDVTPREVLDMPPEALAEAIRPSGYYNQKAPRLKALARWAEGRRALAGGCDGVPTDVLRAELLSLNGVGRETADSILLYGFHRPVFVIDAYTRRLFARLGFEVQRDYDEFAHSIRSCLPEDEALFNEFHALMVVHCKTRCRKGRPDCAGCPLEALCAWIKP